MKRTETSLRGLWDNIKCTNIWIVGVPEEEKKKGYEEFFKEIIVESFPKGKGNSQSSPRGAKSPTQDKHTKTHTNQTNKD